MKNWIAFGLLFSCSAHALTTVMDADALFEKQQYSQAVAAYQENLDVGSPHAYYQLGYMYFQGLGVKKDIAVALIYFSMAAEYNISDAQQVVEHIIASLPEKTRKQQQAFIEDLVAKHGKQAHHQKLFPQTINALLTEKITLEQSVYDEDWFEQSVDEVDDSFDLSSNDFASSFAEEGEFSDLGSDSASSQATARQSSFVSLKDRPYFAVIDYQIAKDGTARDVETSQKMGYVKRRVDDFSRFYKSPVLFNQQASYFVGQQVLGIADMNKFEINDKHPELYSRMRRVAKKLRASEKLADQTQLALALMRFKFLAKTPEEGIELLKHAAEKHWPIAQYEYGMYLYREQIDIAKGIEYIGLAAQYGYSKANFQLATLLQTSPWVKQDLNKALFWYERAAEQNLSHAKLRAAYIRLMDDKKEYYNPMIANKYLAELAEERSRDPDYHFLKALSYRDNNNRQLKLAFEHMRKAIDLADDLNWDTTEWENLYASWTEGRILVSDDIKSDS
ncbi:TPR repeat protein [Catenovulum agarivorans DS-2]|uniref:TPR repeat protein n=1 Tax=Catenovulum agarivorans DS-2 TaxID=1328313 RepID=W7QVD6_9ALTE|nr:SEL1-like repeat protein [Catenovulum agarivorans]EWH11683.1 TPR repeat protein [Catenovulum agarivorans DS-2]